MRWIFPSIVMMELMLWAAALRAEAVPGPTLAIAPATDSSPAPSTPWHPPDTSPLPPLVGAPPAELPPPAGAELNMESNIDPPVDALIGESAPWHAPTVWLGPAPWDTGIEFGLNGSSGTSDSISMRAGAYIKRESRYSKLDLSTDFNLTVDGGKSTQDNGKLDVTHDWLLDEHSPWTLFAKSDLFYDQFAAFDVEMNLNLGLGYRWIHLPDLEFMTRLGSGASREFGGPDNEWKPESLVGMEYSQKVSHTQKFYGKFDYFPQWDQVGEYRMVADVGWEIALIQPSNLSLKISATDRYDSTPEGVNPHLVNYSVLLLLKL